MDVTADRIVRALSGAPDGVGSSDWLARVLGCPPEDLAVPLADLHARGRAIVWQAAEGVLGVILAATMRFEPKRRVQPDPEDPDKPVTLTNLDLGWVPDRRSIAVADRDPCGVPFPGLILLGERLPWPPPDWVPRRPCWACGGRRLSVDTYCLVCDRAGRTKATWGVRQTEVEITRAVPERNGHAGGTGPAEPEPEAARGVLLSAEEALREREKAASRRRRRA